MCLSKGLAAVQQSVKEGVLPNMRLGFIGTAGETYPNSYFVEESRIRLRSLGLSLVELDITNESRERLIAIMKGVDGIYVAGGNSFFLLQQLQKKQLDTYLTDRVREGLPYFGESAGAVLLSESLEPAKPLDDPHDAPDIAGYRGLGLVDFFTLPHVDREKYHAVFEKFIADNEKQIKIVQIRDDQALITRNGSDYEILPSPILDIRGK